MDMYVCAMVCIVESVYDIYIEIRVYDVCKV